MRKLKALWRLIWADTYILYTGGKSDWHNTYVGDVQSLTDRLLCACIIGEQQQDAVNEVNKIINGK